MRYREPVAGGRDRQRSFALRTQADAYAARLDRDKYEGLYLDPKRGEITLHDFAADWLERQVIAEGTYRNYESFLRIHLLPHLGDKTIAAVQPADIETLVATLSSNRLAATTVCDRINMVRQIFATAVKEKRRADNPTEAVKLPRIPSAAIDADAIPTLAAVELIAKQISPQYRLTIHLQAAAGLRISETLAFATDCYRGDYLRVRRQVSTKAHRENCKTRFVPLKHRAAGEYRDVPIPAFLSQEIDTHLEEWGTKTHGKLEVLFAPRDRGKGIMPTANTYTYTYHFRKALKDLGLVTPDGSPQYTPHRLRHFFASTALAQGIPLHEVSRWLGHKSITTTVDIYGHFTPVAWDRCRDTMHNALRPGSPR